MSTRTRSAIREGLRRGVHSTAGIVATAAAGLWLSACGQNTQTITLLSLEASGRTSFLCLNSATFAPRSIEDCPDLVPSVIDGETRHLYSMVTQTTRGEVAVLDLSAGAVVDEDRTVPSYTFLPVGANPTGIVSTPGGVATFVAVAEPGKEGIYALPTSCAKPRQDATDPVRDITMWPACQLPSAPGDMVLLVDSVPGRTTCGLAVEDTTHGSAECPADLSTETVDPGRRLLVVTLPDRGELAVIDAQSLLDRQQGSFQACPVEAYIPLGAQLPPGPIVQQLPPNLAGGPAPAPLVHPPSPERHVPRPGGMSVLADPLTQEKRLYVADLQAPVVHVMDSADPCRLQEGPPLLPVSYVDANRVVKTSRVAVSPLTSDQKRYLYAIDYLDNGSVMIFDVSPGSTNRTPLLRPDAELLPFEPPDRIAFDSPARDVTFASRDVPAQTVPETQPFGIACNPDPSIPATDPAAQYRPSPDLTSGARPAELRGTFGFLALESGQLSLIDVDDLDAKCRRPASLNPTGTPDSHGCSNDPADLSNGYSLSAATATLPKGTATVTDEVSCRMVETHRTRSASAMRNDPNLGVRAPSLQALPRLQDETGRTLVTDRSVDGLTRPRMLGVNFSTRDPAHVFVGTTLFTPSSQENPLIVDPQKADESSLVLDLSEPRAYAPAEAFAARYEGQVIATRPGADYAFDPVAGTATLTDSGIVFCDRGVDDENVACVRGASLLGVPADAVDAACQPAARAAALAANPEEALPRYSKLHADYARILSDIPPQEDTWWQKGSPGARCGGASADVPGAGYLQCSTQLGTSAAPSPNRELHVVSATRNVLTVVPRSKADGAIRDDDLPEGSVRARRYAELLACCFPTTVSYEVRSSVEWVLTGSQSGFRNQVTTAPDGACVFDTDPLRSRTNSRIIEISCKDGDGCLPVPGEGVVGRPRDGEVACIFTAANPPPETIGASPCLYQGLTASFAIYGGQHGVDTPSASTRDMSFQWTVTGGFSPFFVSLSGGNGFSSPNSVVFSPQAGGVVVADGSARGVVVFDLATLAQTPFL